MIVLESDPHVAQYAAQPETFDLRHQDRARRYTPDLVIQFQDGSRSYREVKPARKFAVNPSLDGRLTAIEAECTRRGAGFEVWTDTDIRRQPRLSNCRRVQGAAAFLTTEVVDAATLWISEEQLPSTLRDGSRNLAAPHAAEIILGLIGIGVLTVDMDRVISGDTIVSRARLA